MTNVRPDSRSRWPASKPRQRFRNALPVSLAIFVLGGGVAASIAWFDHSARTQDLLPGIDQRVADRLGLVILPPGAQVTAPNVRLIDQDGHPFSLAQFHGKAVLVSFVNTGCRNACNGFASDLGRSLRDLHASAAHVEYVAVNVNPFDPGLSATRHWTSAHKLARASDWRFGTAPDHVLRAVWQSFAIGVVEHRATETVSYLNQLFFIDPSGNVRAVAQLPVTSRGSRSKARTIATMLTDLLPTSVRRPATK